MKKIFMWTFILVCCAFCINVKASGPYLKITDDHGGFIIFPKDMSNGKGDIDLDTSDEDKYALYYQWIEISESTKDRLAMVSDLHNSWYDEKEKFSTKLLEMYTLAETNFDTINNSSTATQEEINSALEVRNKANKVMAEYKASAETTRESFVLSFNELLPDYDDSKWIKATGLHFDGDFSGYTGKKNYVLYVNLVYEGQDVQNGEIGYTLAVVSGTASTATAPKDDTTQTTTKEEIVENPKTGMVTYTLAIGGGLVVAGGIYYFLRKKNLMKKI